VRIQVATDRVDVLIDGKLELRLEAFNLFNRPNYLKVNNIYGEGPDPAATFLAPVAGITSVDPGRQLQFGVRVRF
jgi:hypothetical protein